jgi:hypothetical protein
MKRSKATPVRLVGLSILGSLIAASAFLVVPVAIHFRDHGNGRFSSGIVIANVICMLVVLCGGGYLSLWSQQELSNGISLDRWSEEQLRPVRAFSESRIAKVAPVVLLILGVVLYLTEAACLHRSVSIGFWVCFVLCNGLIGLRSSLAAPEDSPSVLWLETSEPLRSEHWGE